MRKVVLCIALLLLVAGCGGSGNAPEQSEPQRSEAQQTETQQSMEQTPPTNQQEDGQVIPEVTEAIRATIELENGGKIELELYLDIAPQSVLNFCSLARAGYYDGLKFHRVIEGFMIQGGDPNGDGSGGPGYTIKGEFASNNVENPLKHERGVISMARRGDPFKDSAGSQFFIVHEDSTFLDGSYAAFGKVIDGMDVVDEIATTKVVGESPAEDVIIKTIVIDGPELPDPQKLSE